MKQFKINNEYDAICEWKKTRNGFKHEATLLSNGVEVDSAKQCYLNRTWESFEYQTVLRKLLNKVKIFSDEEKDSFLKKGERQESERVNSMFNTVKMVASIGEIMTDNKKDSNDWKKRMITAGLPGLSFPSDWDTLSEEEKEQRMNDALAVRL